MNKKSLLFRPTFLSVLKIFLNRTLFFPAVNCVRSIFFNFFVLQYKTAAFKKKHIITNVDHPLDSEIPFDTSWINVYMDFSPFWIRCKGFLMEKFGKSAFPEASAFIQGINELYRMAASVYKINFSTTTRPRYFGKIKFIIIHLFDPHLMCIPSLHVILALYTFVKFRETLRGFNAEEIYKNEIEWAREHSVKIIESVLYVKQHSVNCIPAAFWTMTCYDSTLFNPVLINEICASLFHSNLRITKETADKIRFHITQTYERFLREGELSKEWRQPLLNFLKEYQNA